MNDNHVIELARQFIVAAAANNVETAKELFYDILNRFEDDMTQYPAQAFGFAVHCIQNPYAIENDDDFFRENSRQLTANERRIIDTVKKEMGVPVLKAA